MRDYYYILGILPSASLGEIKTAYRNLAMKFHPDKNSGNTFFQGLFNEINEAHEVLSDSKKRMHYDLQRKVDNTNSTSSNHSDSSNESKQKQNTKNTIEFPRIIFFKSNKIEIEKGDTTQSMFGNFIWSIY